jgi:predicted phage tail protein
MAVIGYNAQGGDCDMLRKIRLYGQLAKFVGHRVLEADVVTAAEAVRFLLANWPELERHMADQHYRVHTGGDDLALEEIHNPASGDIKIIPVIAGAGAVGRIILGVALIAFALLIPGAAFGAVLAGKISSGVGNALLIAGKISAMVGASLVLGGVSQLLTPTPKTNKDEGDPRKSFSFSGIQNTSRAGLPVPVVYGEMLVGSVVVSAGVDIVQVAA